MITKTQTPTQAKHTALLDLIFAQSRAGAASREAWGPRPTPAQLRTLREAVSDVEAARKVLAEVTP